MATADERRQNQRFPMELPVELNLGKVEGESGLPSAATVRDISSTGVYFYAPEKMEDGGKVEFFVRLQEPGGSMPGVFLHCLGSIIRTDTQAPESGHEGQVGVAVHIDRYRFLRPDEKTPEPAGKPS